MIIELLSDQITSSIVEAIWNRPEIAMLREPIERRLSAKTFRDKTRRALQDFEQSSASLLPDLFSSKFVGQKEVQRCLSDYIVAGRPADITRFLELYAKNRGGGESVTLSPAAKDSVRRYFEHLRESLASDPEYGPLLAARDQKTMLSALDTISEGFLSVKEQVDRLTDVLQTLSKTPEFRQIERRTAALPDVFAQHVVPVLAELGVRDLRNIAEAALGSDSPLLANFTWPQTPDEAAQRLCEALGTAEGYPGRAAIAALLQAAMHYSPAHASRLADPLELVSGMLERRTRATYIEEGLLCIAHADERVAQALANELRAAGLNVWLDSEAVMAGHSLRQQRFDAVEHCETLVLCLTAGALDDGAVRRMAASAALLGKQILILPFDTQANLRAYPDTAPLAELAPVRLDDPARAGEAVIAALTAVRVTRNPYKGLEAFDETDAPYYFGHEALIERLVQLVALAGVGGFAAVIGSSGSGKSSLVRAGLLPRLRAAGWRIAVLRPGPRPLAELATAVSSLTGRRELELIERFSKPGASLRSLFDGTRAALILDQFEEVFTQSRPDEAAEFIRLVTEVSGYNPDLICVLTMRSDYLPAVEQYPALARLIEARSVITSQMSADDLRRSITEPARVANLRIEEGLVKRILIEVQGEGAALPLLQFALSQLYHRRTAQNVLTVEAYESVGGLRDALALHAESIYGRMSERQQTIMRRLMLELVAPSEHDEFARARRDRSMLAFESVSDSEIQTVIDYLAASGNRLLTLSRDDRGVIWVEVSHEALLNRWFRCRDWISANRQNIADRAVFEDEAQQWLAAGRDRSYLRSGARLSEAQGWLARGGEFVSAAQREYIAASERHEAQRRRNLVYIAAGAVGLACLAALLGVVAVIQWGSEQSAREAAEQSLIEARAANLEARSGQTALQAILEAQSANFDTALLLSSQAVGISNTVTGRSSLLTILQNVADLQRYLHGHDGDVLAVTYSPDGRFVITAGADSNVRLWDAYSGQSVAVLQQHQAAVVALDFLSAQTLVSADADGTVILWDVTTGAEINRFDTGDSLHALDVAPSGEQIATGHARRGVQIWTSDGRREFVLDDLEEVFALAYSPDGSLLALADSQQGGAIQLRSVTDQYRAVGELAGHTNWVRALAFSPDGVRLASGGADSTVRVWDVAGRQALGAPQRDHSGWVRSLRFSPDGDRLASTADDGIVILRDRGGVRLANTPPLNVQSGTVYGHAFHPQDEALAVSVGADAIVAQWGGSEPLARPLSAHRGAVFQALWSADGTQVVTASADGSVLIWDAAAARLTGSPIPAQGQVLSLALHGETLAFATDSGQIALWDTAAGAVTASVDIGTAVRSLAFDSVSGLLASAGDDGVIRLWDVAAFTNPVAELAAHTDWVNAVAFSSDGRLLASGGADARVLLWDVESRSIVSELPAVYANMVTALAFSPDGDLLASASRDGSARLWSISGEGWVGTEMIHDGRWILDVDFSPDGDLLATVSQSGSVQLWEVSSQQAVGLPLSGHADWALSVSFHPDGRGLVSTSRDQTARLWSIDPVDWQERACSKANRALTTAEVNRYLGGEPGALVCTG